MASCAHLTTHLLLIYCPSTNHLLPVSARLLPIYSTRPPRPPLLLTTYYSLLTSYLLLGTGDGRSEHSRAIRRIRVGRTARWHTCLGLGEGQGEGYRARASRGSGQDSNQGEGEGAGAGTPSKASRIYRGDN